MLQAPLNNFVVKVHSKYHKNFNRMVAMANINPGTQVNGADYVNIYGTIVSVPMFVSDRIDYKGYSPKGIKAGDIGIFRYDVIYDFMENPEGGDALYRNLVWFKGEEYFMVDIQKLFGIIRDDKITMVNGYCMVEEMSNPSALILPQHMKNVIQAASATLTNIGSNLTHLQTVKAKPGDTVYYNPSILQTYEINDKKFGIISQRHILGRKVGKYSDVQRII